MKAIILADNLGMQMKSQKHDILHKILDKPMAYYPIVSAMSAGADEVYLVSEQPSDLEEPIGDILPNVSALTYEQCIEKFTNESGLTDETIMVIYGNTPLIKPQTLKKLALFHLSPVKEVSAVMARNGKDELPTTPVFIASLSVVKGFLESGAPIKPDDTATLYIDDSAQLLTVTNRQTLSEAGIRMRERINNAHMDNGVTIIDPSRCEIGPEVRIGMDTTICSDTIIEGETLIGQNCNLGPNTRISSCVIADNVDISYSVMRSSSVGSFTEIGPFAYIRPDSVIGAHCKVGDFVEVKNSRIGDNTKASHLTYVGDSDVGKNVNFGCGTVTVNYDGRHKHRTVIRDNAFIGCNTNLVAPVTIYEDAFIAAGSTIVDNVPEQALAIARTKQINKAGWNRK